METTKTNHTEDQSAGNQDQSRQEEQGKHNHPNKEHEAPADKKKGGDAGVAEKVDGRVSKPKGH